MKKLLLILLCLPMIGFGQISSFEFSKQRSAFPNQYVVLELDSLSTEDLYDRTLEWIVVIAPKLGSDPVSLADNTNSISIKNKIENLYIKMEGVISANLECYYHSVWPIAGYTDLRYHIEFAFKENKVKFDIINIQYYISQVTIYHQMGWADLNLEHSNMYKKNGKIKQDKLEQTNRMIEYFNGLALSLYNHLETPIEKNTSEEDDW